MGNSLVASTAYFRHRFRNTSYSQDGEDRILADLLGRVSFFIDIGANDGITHSNTFYFAVRGARGICLEPVAETFKRLKVLYRFAFRVKCLQVAVSDSSRMANMLHPEISGLSCITDTQDKEHARIHADHLKRSTVESIRLEPFAKAVAGCSVPSTVDLLSVDVEGHELNVLRSIPFDKYRFRAIILETHIADQWRHRDYDALVSLLRQPGYHVARTTKYNTIFCQL